MKVLLAGSAAVFGVAGLTVWLFFGVGHATDLGVGRPAPGAEAKKLSDSFVVHEWVPA
jgi:hypothetical protein